MKKKFLTLIMVATMIFGLVGCSGTTTTVENANESNKSSMFVVVESTSLWDVVYHKDTKVMYVVSRGSYNQGTFTVMVNSEGTPLIYGE